jgi:hypothetical protein
MKVILSQVLYLSPGNHLPSDALIVTPKLMQPPVKAGISMEMARSEGIIHQECGGVHES